MLRKTNRRQKVTLDDKCFCENTAHNAQASSNIGWALYNPSATSQSSWCIQDICPSHHLQGTHKYVREYGCKWAKENYVIFYRTLLYGLILDAFTSFMLM